MMYAIVKKVTSPPRTSRAVVEPRLLIENQRSSPDGGVAVVVGVAVDMAGSLGPASRRVGCCP